MPEYHFFLWLFLTKKKIGLLRVYYVSLGAHFYEYSYADFVTPVPLEAWLLKASPADVRKLCVCPPALRELRTYDNADFSNDA